MFLIAIEFHHFPFDFHSPILPTTLPQVLPVSPLLSS